MFKALNPYMLLAMDTAEMPITDIWPGATPEETELCLDTKRSDGTPQRRKWNDVAGIRYYEVKIKGRGKVNRAIAEILLEYALWMDGEVSKWKDPIPPRPWNPEDSILSWFLPYLRVATVADLRQALAEDIKLLKSVKILDMPAEQDKTEN